MSHPYVEHKTVALMKGESQVIVIRETGGVRRKGIMGRHSLVHNSIWLDRVRYCCVWYLYNKVTINEKYQKIEERILNALVINDDYLGDT